MEWILSSLSYFLHTFRMGTKSATYKIKNFVRVECRSTVKESQHILKCQNFADSLFTFANNKTSLSVICSNVEMGIEFFIRMHADCVYMRIKFSVSATLLWEPTWDLISPNLQTYMSFAYYVEKPMLWKTACSSCNFVAVWISQYYFNSFTFCFFQNTSSQVFYHLNWLMLSYLINVYIQMNT